MNSPSSPPACTASRSRKQNGAPLRVAVPWKYGFKSIKSIVRFTFTDERPKSSGKRSRPAEYGFWANVNPEVPHPRWSQAEETPLGSAKGADLIVQRLCGVRRRSVQRNGKRAAIHVISAAALIDRYVKEITIRYAIVDTGS